MTDDEPNEILAATKEVKATRERAEKSGWPIGKIAVGVGVGSAALAAALLYGRSKGKKD